MLKELNFYKYQGTGNDFILINAFYNNIQLEKETIEKLCHRRFGIGADGLMILRPKEGFDFEMDFYNSDGNKGSMCGNGGRCIVAFAHDLGLIKEKSHFWAPDGEHEAIFYNHDRIALKMIDVNLIENHELGLYLNTGSPHLVLLKENEISLNVFEEGKKIRYSDTYKQVGVNVNFVVVSPSELKIFTYERGVENQTFSCGTGTVAAAIALNKELNYLSPIEFNTLGGKLSVSFEKNAENSYKNNWLIGPATQIFKGYHDIIG